MSRRNYLSQAELEQYADITIIDPVEADDQISQAEEFIDGLVGYQSKFLDTKRRVFGTATAATSTTLTDTHTYGELFFQYDNYFIYCQIEILGGTGAGQRRRIVSSSRSAASVTVDSAWDTTPDTTSSYQIVQIGKFPRLRDAFQDPSTLTFSKVIPEMVKRATAAQVQYMITLGAQFFAGDDSIYKSERIGKYEYMLADGISSKDRLIAPKAKEYLKGFINKGGKIVDNGPPPQLGNIFYVPPGPY